MMKKMFSKFLVSLLAGIVLFLSVTPAVMAQSATSTPGPWYNQNFGQWSAKVFGGDQNEIFGERYTYAQVNWIVNSLIAMFIGSDITKCISLGTTGNMSEVGGCMKSFNVDPTKLTSPTKSGAQGGAIGGLAYLTNALLNTKPASGVEYIKTTASKLHVIPQAYAQTGVGYNALSPVQTVWNVVRDISYALMVVVIIAMAFMIMFRMKISPQVVITVQSALPKVAIALVLITFSYAIAGLLVDLMYLIVGVFAVMIKIGGSAIVATPGMASPPSGVNALNTVGLFNQLVSGNGLVSIVVSLVVLSILFLLIGAALFFTGALATVTAVGAIAGVPLLLGAVLILILAIVTLLIILKLFWLMAKTACVTVLLIIIGPLMILVGTVANGMSFTSWIRIVLSNLAVYPTVIIMVFLSHYFFWGWFLGGASAVAPIFPYLNTFGINWTTTGPNVVNLPGMPIGTNVIGLILAFVILFLIPQAANIVQGLITGKGFDLGRGINEAMAPVNMVRGTAGSSLEAAARNAEQTGTWVSGLPYRALQSIVGRGR